MNERELLIRLIHGPASGAALARTCGQTRAAVWKRIDALRDAGRRDRRPARARLCAARSRWNCSMPTPIRAPCRRPLRAGDRRAGSRLVAGFDQQRTAAAPDRRRTGAAVLLAERQTGGRGRRGRDWASPLAANLYLSLARMFSGGLARLRRAQPGRRRRQRRSAAGAGLRRGAAEVAERPGRRRRRRACASSAACWSKAAANMPGRRGR